MVNLMLCRHTKTKYKLTSWATKTGLVHSQGFIMVKCCTYCGCVIKQGVNNGV